MSQTWICTKCHTTMISKCPSARSVFMSPEMSMLNNALYTKVIRREDGVHEVVISYTNYGAERSSSDGTTLKKTIESLHENRELLERSMCDHDWVINSETEDQCTLDHKHRNLSSPTRPESPQELFNLPATLKEFNEPISVLLEQARVTARMSLYEHTAKNLHFTKEYKRQACRIDDQSEELKTLVRRAVEQFATSELVRPKFRISHYRAYNDPRNWDVALDHDAGAEAIYWGLVGLGVKDIELQSYNEKMASYTKVDCSTGPNCPICKKTVDLSQPHVSGQWHVKCYLKHERKQKICTQLINVALPSEIAKRRDEYVHDYFDGQHNGEQSLLEYHIMQYISAHTALRPVLERACINGWMPQYKTGVTEQVQVSLSLQCSEYEAVELVQLFKNSN